MNTKESGAKTKNALYLHGHEASAIPDGMPATHYAGAWWLVNLGAFDALVDSEMVEFTEPNR